MPTSGQTLHPNRPGEKNTRAPRSAGVLMCTSHPPVAVRSSRGRAASDKAPGTLSIPQLWSCVDNPRESGESCECILVLRNVHLGKSGATGATNVILTAQTLNFQPSTVRLATAQRSDDAPECGEH